MSDSSSEDEDLAKFKEAVDHSFAKIIERSRQHIEKSTESTKDTEKQKSERHLEVASHYNDVKVAEGIQRQIGAKISAVISNNVKFVDVASTSKQTCKIEGGVKLFKDSEGFLSCEDPKDTYTEQHNNASKKIALKRKCVEKCGLDENDKIKSVAVSGDYVLSKEETKSWKSRRKEKLFKYKSQGKNKTLIAVE